MLLFLLRAPSSYTKPRASTYHSFFCMSPKYDSHPSFISNSPPTTTFVLHRPYSLISLPYPTCVKNCSVPGCTASSQLFAFQKLTSEIVFSFFPCGALCSETHPMPEIKDCWMRNRKKGSCCRFHFSVTKPEVVVVVCFVLSFWTFPLVES